MAQPCPSCGRTNRDDARFCDSCGSPLAAAGEPAREERKVVTVLFADLVGFTSHSERLDPEDVRATLSPYYQRLRSELERFGGTVEKFIGDAVMAIFGAPVSHEDDPERAVRAALAIRDWILEQEEALQVRIGVNTGEALVTLGSRPSEGEGMAAGDVVNTAARLQSAAPVNGILVGETAYRATRRAIDYAEREPVAAKGKSEPISVWEAVEARSRLGVDVEQAASTPLLGREADLDALRAALARAREEREPQLVTLVGVPGIGKSRLVYELFRLVEADPELIVWRQGRSLPYGEGVTFWALAEMVKAQAGILETDSPRDAAEKLRRAAADAVAEQAEWAESHLRPLVGLATETELGGERQGEAFAAWRAFFEGLAEQGPVVLVFEDLQWADDGLLDFLDHLVDWATGVPLLVVCTTRPELLSRRPGWGGGKPNAATISLSPLSQDDTARIVHALLERAVLPADLQAKVLARAGGNPLYAEEFARMLAERGPAGEDELSLPESLQGIIAARLDALTPGEKSLLHDAAVLGKVFWSGALAALGGRGRSDIERDLHSLERKEFLRRERRASVAGESEYAFRHVLVRDVAYGQIPRGERGEKHRGAAEWIESLSTGRSEDRAEMLAHHYGAALDYLRATGRDASQVADRARVALAEAGDRAASLLAFAAAARFYARALELWPLDGDDRAGLLYHYGKARYFAEDKGAAELTEARDGLLRAGDRELAAESEIMLADLEWKRANSEQAFELLDHAHELVGMVPASRAKAYVLSSISRFLMLAGRNEEAIRLGLEALEMAEQLGLEDLSAHALNNMGVARVTSGDLDGVRDLERSIAIAKEANSPWDMNRGLLNLGSIKGQLGYVREMKEMHLESLEVARRFGLGGPNRWSTAELARGEYSEGNWDRSISMVDDFLAVSEQSQPHYLDTTCRLVRAEVRLARGDDAGALADVFRSLELARKARDPQILWPVLGFGARILCQAGRIGEAAALADECLELWRAEGDAQLLAAEWVVPLAWVLVAFDREPELLEAVSGVGMRTRWLTAAIAIASADFVRAADGLAEIGHVPEEAWARLHAAESLIAAGRRAAGEVELQRALAFYRTVRASAYIQRGERLLAASA